MSDESPAPKPKKKPAKKKAATPKAAASTPTATKTVKVRYAMTDGHKAALSVARTEAATVRRYLEALDGNRPKRGRRRTPESIGARLNTVDAALAAGPDPVSRLSLVQEQMDLRAELDLMANGGSDLPALEAAYVAVAASYSERKGVSWQAWRQSGVAPAVLKRAGVRRR